MKLLEEVREYLRTRHLAIRTERAYLRWIERFLRYERQLAAAEWRHPAEMGAASRWASVTGGMG